MTLDSLVMLSWNTYRPIIEGKNTGIAIGKRRPMWRVLR